MARRVSLILSALFAAATLASAVILTFQRGRSVSDSILDLAIWVLSIAGVILLLNALAGAWALRASRRAARLRVEMPDAVVIESGRLGGLGKFLTVNGPIDLVQYLAVTFDRTGITFWRDYSPHRVWHRVAAESANAISVEEFIENNRLRLRLRISRRDGDILIPVLGRGLVRLMSPPKTIVESLASQITVLTGWNRE